jgi:hypothetical protein
MERPSPESPSRTDVTATLRAESTDGKSTSLVSDRADEHRYETACRRGEMTDATEAELLAEACEVSRRTDQAISDVLTCDKRVLSDTPRRAKPAQSRGGVAPCMCVMGIERRRRRDVGGAANSKRAATVPNPRPLVGSERWRWRSQ